MKASEQLYDNFLKVRGGMVLTEVEIKDYGRMRELEAEMRLAFENNKINTEYFEKKTEYETLKSKYNLK